MALADMVALVNAMEKAQRLSQLPGLSNTATLRAISYENRASPSVAGAALTGPSPQVPIAAPVAGHNLYLAEMLVKASLSTYWGLYDRLVETGGLSGTVATAQTVNSVALPTRATGGAGVQLWIEWYTATGATQTTVTASYTNQAGAAGQTTPATNFQISPLASANNGREMQQLPLQSGDTGVRSVQSVTLAATTGTAGNFGILLVKPIVWSLLPAVVRVDLDALQLGLPAITSDMFLTMWAGPNSSSGTNLSQQLVFVED